MKGLLSAGDKVVVMAPAYQSLYELADAAGCSMCFWEPQLAEGGRVEYRVQDLLVSLKVKGVHFQVEERVRD
jgi:aspartate/methionine/tyrosine aminotransferase